jgi:hypothetical protein
MFSRFKSELSRGYASSDSKRFLSSTFVSSVPAGKPVRCAQRSSW